MFPIMLNWANVSEYPNNVKNPDDVIVSRYQIELGIYAPTGNFESGTLVNSGAPANIGRNYWTFEPSAAADYFIAPTKLDQYNLEFTISSGFDFNTENGATHYQNRRSISS
jgi:hypothetical protein